MALLEVKNLGISFGLSLIHIFALFETNKFNNLDVLANRSDELSNCKVRILNIGLIE